MRIALTMRVVEAASYHEPRDAVSHDWQVTLAGWGMVPLLVPNRLADPAAYVAALGPDLLVLAGGEDPGTDRSRDETEKALLAYAMINNLPVLGVCRGLQLLNMYFGGGLIPVDGHVGGTHDVTFMSPLLDIYGDRTEVNSFHGTGAAADDLAPGLIAAARDMDGHIEALVHEKLPIAAVMWHPERAGAPAGDELLIRRLAGDGAFWR